MVVPNDGPTFANVYAGTSTGHINEVSMSLVGCRVVKDEQFGTIKYVGPIAGSTVTWLGVDWDNPENGRHDGTFKGTKYFTTHHPTSGSFLKPAKASLGTSLEEALVTRYAMCAECQILVRNFSRLKSGSDPASAVKLETGASAGHLRATMDMNFFESEYLGNTHSKLSSPFTVEIFTNSSGDLNNHEMCGSGGALAKLSQLRFACIPGMPVFRALRKNENIGDDVRTLWPGPGGHMSEYLRILQELDLSGCLISKWIEVAAICKQLPRLQKLNVGSNRLRLPRLTENEHSELPETERRLFLDIDTDIGEAESLFRSAFGSLSRLVVVQMPSAQDGGVEFRWNEVTRILEWMPSLNELCLAYNKLGDLPDPNTEVGRHLMTLLLRMSEVDLTGTGQTNFARILQVLGKSKNLLSLILNVNQIVQIRVPRDTDFLQALRLLTLRDNLINEWGSVNSIAAFKSLSSLIISQNPILSSTTPETARQEVIARIPQLKILNRQEIERDERRGAEVDFLKRYGKAWAEAKAKGNGAIRAFDDQFPAFQLLCDKHGAPDSGESKSVIRALKEGLVEMTISCEPPVRGAPAEVVKRLPARMTVNHLRSLVRRLFRLPSTVSIKLVTWGPRPGFDNVEVPLDSDTREIGFFGIVSGDRLVARWTSEN